MSGVCDAASADVTNAPVPIIAAAAVAAPIVAILEPAAPAALSVDMLRIPVRAARRIKLENILILCVLSLIFRPPPPFEHLEWPYILCYVTLLLVMMCGLH